jgi:hypothetical protein
MAARFMGYTSWKLQSARSLQRNAGDGAKATFRGAGEKSGGGQRPPPLLINKDAKNYVGVAAPEAAEPPVMVTPPTEAKVMFTKGSFFLMTGFVYFFFSFFIKNAPFKNFQ